MRISDGSSDVCSSDLTRAEVARWVEAARNPASDLRAAEIALAEAELEVEDAEHELTSARMTLAASWGAIQPDFTAVTGDLRELPPVESFEVLRSEEHTSELQSLMRISYAVFCLKKQTK